MASFRPSVVKGMSTTQRKRHRANTQGEATDPNESAATTSVPDVDYQFMIDTFDQATTKTLLYFATLKFPAVANDVIVHHQRVVAAEAERIKDFDGPANRPGMPLPTPTS